MQNKLLHISSAFAIQKIYVNLVESLSRKGREQIVYVPVRNSNQIDGNRRDSIPNCDYHYSLILKDNLWFKVRYKRKIRIILQDLLSKVKIDDVGLVHAHFLFSDGGVAYLLNKRYGIPYVVSVRATDLFYFFRLMIHQRNFGNRIMSTAERVIFINPTYVNIFKKKYISNVFREDIERKITVIPNAISEEWFEKDIQKELPKQLRLLYVGQIIKRKKLDVVLNSVKYLNKTSDLVVSLDIVGEGPFLKNTQSLFDQNTRYHGRITDFKRLSKVFESCHIFVMPSVKETFGLVYIEALSKGLPIIYCQGEGIDGFFPSGEVGVAVAPNSIEEVAKAIEYIIANYSEISYRALKAACYFNWENISEKYNEVYEKALL